MPTDNIKGGAIPQAQEEATECMLSNKKICSSPNEIEIMRKYLSIIDPEISSNLGDREIIRYLKKKLGVSSESAIWENQKFKEFVGERRAEEIIKRNFIPIGPSDSTALLDNFNIDESMTGWSKRGMELFGRKFYNIPFQMIDFEKVGSELSRTTLEDIINQGYDCFGVVLNTDTSDPGHRGKHWFCLFGDFRHKGTADDPYTLEYFNSSGNPPMNEVSIWMQNAVHKLKRDTKKHCVIVRSAPRRVQFSDTECGVFSLMYIKSRLEGHPPDWFYKVKADDKDMILLRKHLFRKKS